MDHAVTGSTLAGAAKLEEGDIGAGASSLVGVEQVIDTGLVLIDGLFHHSQAESARIKVDVLLRVGGDRGYVVNSFELHLCRLASQSGCRLTGADMFGN